jgi:two-component system, OmpR family, sensor kinase
MSDKATAPHSLSGALTRALLPWIAMLWVATSAAVGWYMQHELTEQLDAGLVESAERLLDLAAHDARNHQHPSERDGTLYRLEVPHSNLSGTKHDVLLYQVVNDRNELLLRSADAPLSALPIPLTTGFFNTPTLRTYTLAHPTLPMFIHVGDPLAHRSAARTETLVGLLVPLLVILPLLGLLIRAVTQRVLAPAGLLATELQQRDGHYLAPLPGQGLPVELQTMVDSANHLLHRLSDALDTERALAANAAHELRTPLAAVRLNLQTALCHVPGGAAHADIQNALQSLDRLSRRCEKLLQLSRAESGAGLAQDRVNLGQVAAAVAQEFWADTALLQRLQLVLPEDDDVWVRGDFDALAIALRNLIENAVRYAPEGPIVLEVALPATCSVRDGGPGLRSEQIAQLQQRHQRNGLGQHLARTGPGARTVHRPGYGLGLSIVTTIVERQGGRCSLQSPPPGKAHGLQASLHLRADVH